MIGSYFLRYLYDIVFSNKSYSSCVLQLLITFGSILSITLSELYLSWSLYLYLIEEIKIKNYQVALIIAGLFIFQFITLRLTTKLFLKKTKKSSIIAQDYHQIRNVLNHFILGFQKK